MTCPACGHEDAEEMVCPRCAERGETVWMTAREGFKPLRAPGKPH